MTSTQIITLRGRSAAITVNATAITRHPAGDVAHVQAKALYALDIADGALPGPYTDADAEDYANRAAAAPPRSPVRRCQ